jgi:predicted transcriptional regulator
MKSAFINIRVAPETKRRLADLAKVTRRTQSFIAEEALEAYLNVNEWQVKGILEAISEADRPDAKWVDHADVTAKWEAKREGKRAKVA